MTFSLLLMVLTVCVLLEGFFSGSEIAVVNANKHKLWLAAERGSRRAQLALNLTRHPARFFTITLLGTNVCTVAGSVATTFYIIAHYGESHAFWAILFWPITLIFGELVPKSLYQYHADRIVLISAPVLMLLSSVLAPVMWPLTQATEWLLGRVKQRYGDEPSKLSRDDLELMLEMGEAKNSDVKATERTLISRIFDLAEKKVQNIMTPLVDVIAIPVTATRDEAMRLMEEQEFSRILVYEQRILNVIGVLADTDLLFGDPKASIRELMHPPYYVPEEMPLDVLLVKMKRLGHHLAVVVDEYGAATGLVTGEDLLEEVVGEIHDERDEVRLPYVRLGRNRFLVNGRMEIELANERLKLNIPPGNYETVAGFLIHVAEHIPVEGETVLFQHLKFTVRRATHRAVIEVEVEHLPVTPAGRDPITH